MELNAFLPYTTGKFPVQITPRKTNRSYQPTEYTQRDIVLLSRTIPYREKHLLSNIHAIGAGHFIVLFCLLKIYQTQPVLSWEKNKCAQKLSTKPV